MAPLARAAWTLWGLLAALIGLPALLYVLVAETWSTRLVIAAVLGALAASATLLRGRGRAGAALAVLGVVCGGLALARAPDGAGQGAARTVYTAAYPYPRYGVANVIPEIDQMKLGTYLAPALDPILTVSSAARLRRLTMEVYRPMDADAAFAPLGSAMTYAYEEGDSGHLYSYVPSHAPGERLGALVFLHGSGGNFKVYTHLLTRVAERERLVIVSPSFGFGNWQREGGTGAVERARRHAVETLGADSTRVFLAGLSNGGRGITRALAANGDAYRAVIAISAVLETELIDVRVSVRARNMPALVVYGTEDDRIPTSHETQGAAALAGAGLRVRSHAYEGEDHFLLFSRRVEVLDEIASFIHDAPAR
jgi:pimeloyl-ACP methyl ester carboxylesterase